MAVWTLLSGILLSTAASAASGTYAQCLNTVSTNLEMGGCGQVYLKTLDDDLNAAWKRAYATLSDQPSRASLLEEQRAWIKFRDASCMFYSNGSFGREGQSVHFFGCRAEILQARINTLKGIYELAHQDQK